LKLGDNKIDLKSNIGDLPDRMSIDLNNYISSSDSQMYSGKYSTCIILKSVSNDSIINTNIYTFEITGKDEITVISPSDKSVLSKDLLQFSWKGPTFENSQEILFRFILVEVASDQPPEDAIKCNPAYYTHDRISGNQISISTGITKLNSPQQYAWQIEAYCQNIKITTSRVQEFVYDKSGKLMKMNLSDSFDYSDIKNYIGKYQIQKFNDKKYLKSLKKNTKKSIFSIGNNEKVLKKTPVNITGTAKLEGYYSDQKDTVFGISPEFFRLDIQPEISVYGLPFCVYGFYTSETFNQYRNSISLDFDYDKYKKNLTENIKQKYEYVNSLSRMINVSSLTNSPDLNDFNSLSQLYDYTRHKNLFSSYDQLDIKKYEDLKKLKILNEINSLDKYSVYSLKDNLLDSIGIDSNSSYKKMKDLYELKDWLNSEDKRYKKRIEDSLEKVDPEKFNTWKEIKDFSKFSNPKDSLKDKLKTENSDVNYLTKTEKFFLNVKKLSFGKTYPSLSELTLRGIAITGVDFVFTPKYGYIAFIYGKTTDNFYYIYNNKYRIERKAIGGTLGIGKKEESHFHINLVESHDHSNSSLPDSTYGLLHLHRNYIISAEFRYKYKERMDIIGEYAKSLLYNLYDTIFNTETNNFGWVENLLSQRQKQYSNSAFVLKATLNLPETKTVITGNFKRIAPAYNTLLIPYLKRDNILYDLKINQKFLKNKLALTIFFKNESNNVGQWKETTTSLLTYGLKTNINLIKNFSINLDYLEYHQKNDNQITEMKIDNRIKIMNLNLTYRKKINKTSIATNLIYTFQQLTSAIGYANFQSHMVAINEMLAPGKNFSINGRFSIIIPNDRKDTANTYSIDITTNYLILKRLNLSGGFNYSFSKSNYSYCMFLGVNYPVSTKLAFNFRIEQYYYKIYYYTGNKFSQIISNMALVYLF
jgi:hypothetical protein